MTVPTSALSSLASSSGSPMMNAFGLSQGEQAIFDLFAGFLGAAGTGGVPSPSSIALGAAPQSSSGGTPGVAQTQSGSPAAASLQSPVSTAQPATGSPLGAQPPAIGQSPVQSLLGSASLSSSSAAGFDPFALLGL